MGLVGGVSPPSCAYLSGAVEAGSPPPQTADRRQELHSYGSLLPPLPERALGVRLFPVRPRTLPEPSLDAGPYAARPEPNCEVGVADVSVAVPHAALARCVTPDTAVRGGNGFTVGGPGSRPTGRGHERGTGSGVVSRLAACQSTQAVLAPVMDRSPLGGLTGAPMGVPGEV